MICVFSRRNERGRIAAVAIIHVDDVLVAAVPDEIRRFVAMTDKASKHGGFHVVENNQPIVFCGLQIIRPNKGVWGLPHDNYRANIPRYSQNDFFGKDAKYSSKA